MNTSQQLQIPSAAQPNGLIGLGFAMEGLKGFVSGFCWVSSGCVISTYERTPGGYFLGSIREAP